MLKRGAAIVALWGVTFCATLGFGSPMAMASGLTLDIPASAYQGGSFTNYTVRNGETLESIGKVHGFDADLLASINNIPKGKSVAPGKKLLIPSNGEVSHTVIEGDTLNAIAQLYGVSAAQMMMANDIWDANDLPVGHDIYIPGVTVQQVSAKRAATRSSVFDFRIPVKGVLTSPFGTRSGNEFHTGVDLACNQGTPVQASEQGEVIFSGWKGNYGKCVIIDHQNGYQTLYAHNSKLNVKKGQWVKKGQAIASVGSTGRSTGPHVHFEIRKDGKVVNPLTYVK